MQRVGQRAQAHRAGRGQQCELATLADTHLVLIHAHAGVEAGVERADAATHRLSERGLVVCLALVLEQAAQLHHLGGNDAVGRVAAEELVGIAGGPHGALVVERGLQGELHAGLEFVRMLGANLDNVARKLMAHDGRMLSDILVDALMLDTQDSTLIGGHADTVGYHLDQNFVVLDLGQLKLLQTEVVSGVQTDCFCFHSKNLLCSHTVR